MLWLEKLLFAALAVGLTWFGIHKHVTAMSIQTNVLYWQKDLMIRQEDVMIRQRAVVDRLLTQVGHIQVLITLMACMGIISVLFLVYPRVVDKQEEEENKKKDE